MNSKTDEFSSPVTLKIKKRELKSLRLFQEEQRKELEATRKEIEKEKCNSMKNFMVD